MDEETADEDTVCSFCGMSHLMYAEMRKKERRIAELEKALVSSGAEGASSAARPVSSQATRSHYDQLQQMQESCAKKLEGLSNLEARLAAAEKEAHSLRASVVDAGKALTEEKRQRQAEAAKHLTESGAASAHLRSLEERSEQLASLVAEGEGREREMRSQLRNIQAARDQAEAASRASAQRAIKAMRTSQQAVVVLRRDLDSLRHTALEAERGAASVSNVDGETILRELRRSVARTEAEAHKGQTAARRELEDSRKRAVVAEEELKRLVGTRDAHAEGLTERLGEAAAELVEARSERVAAESDLARLAARERDGARPAFASPYLFTY